MTDSIVKDGCVGTVLIIHGWAQNEAVIRTGTKRLTQKLIQEAGFRVVFPEAPHVLPKGNRVNARAWYLFNEDDPSDMSLMQPDLKIKYHGLEEGLQVIHDHYLNQIPHHHKVICLGFSQGASIVHMLAAHDRGTRIQKVILTGGFRAMHDSYDDAFLSNINIPSLHLIGLKDNRVLPGKQYALARSFVEPTVIEHEKGHLIPQQSELCQAIVHFLST